MPETDVWMKGIRGNPFPLFAGVFHPDTGEVFWYREGETLSDATKKIIVDHLCWLVERGELSQEETFEMNVAMG